MPRPRTPTEVKENRGSFKVHPERRPDGEPEPVLGIGLPPEHMTEAEKSIWHEIVNISYAGVLGEGDRLALEALCKLVYKMRFQWEDMKGQDLARLHGLLSGFGMTPADRSRINVPKTKKSNPFEDMN